MLVTMPLISKLLFAGSFLAIIITAISVLIAMRKYRKELKAHRSELAKNELEEARRRRQEKEAEVIRRYWETQQQLQSEGQLQAAADTHH
jgi:hypothetical protein